MNEMNNQEKMKGLLKKLSLFENTEIPLETTIFGINFDEKLFMKFTTGFIQETQNISKNELEELLKWDLVVKYLITMKNFNKKTASIAYSLNTSIVYNLSNQEGQCQEFLYIKCHYITPYVLIYDEKISTKTAFFLSFFSFGLFQIQSKPVAKNLLMITHYLNGIKYTFPGLKETGVFNEFELQKGTRIKNFEVSELVDQSKKVYSSRVIDQTKKQKYEGLMKNGLKCYYGNQFFSSGVTYEGGFEGDLASNKGVVLDNEGKMIYKGFFENGIPTWGLFYKEKSKRYEGIFKQISGFYNEVSFASIEDFKHNFQFEGTFISPEEKIVSTKGNLSLSEDTFELTGYFHIIYDSLNEYIGYLQKGIKKGLGSYLIKRDNEIYVKIQGIWSLTQVKAVIYWDSENSFKKSIGNFSYNEFGSYNMQDFGILYFKNGNHYEGSFLNNKLHRFGEFRQDTNNLTKHYRGEFSQSLRSGFGVLEDSNLETNDKTIYVGSFLKNKKNGFGILTYNKELLIEGLFSDNVIKFGFLFMKNHPLIEKIVSNLKKDPQNPNEFINHGFGVVYLKDGRSLECDIPFFLEDPMSEIEGRLTYSKGNKVFEGLLVKMKPNGVGELYRNQKLIYSGEFVDGKFHGLGWAKLPGNKEYVGYFSNGLKEGFGVEYSLPDKKIVYRGYWKNGLKENKGMTKGGNGLNKRGAYWIKKNEVLVDL